MSKELRGMLCLVGAMWLVHLIDVCISLDLNLYGLTPRTWSGLPGIVTMPFLHANWGHLISNTFPLCILLFILIQLRRDHVEVIASIVVFGGLLLWCFGRSAYHVGASGLVYGLVAFLIASGFIERKVVPILVSIFVGFLYGTTLLSGVLPFVNEHVSWDGHLFGAVSGVLTAMAVSKFKDQPADPTTASR